MSTDTQSANPPKSALFIAFLVVAIDLLGFGIVLPLLPRYAKVVIPEQWSEAWSGVIIGALFSSFSAMQFIFAPAWGRWSDRVGRRPVLLIGLAGSVFFYALFGYASTLTAPGERLLGLALFFVSRIGAGIAGATISTAAAVIADCTTPEKRSKGMALIGAAFGIGFTFGPLVAYAGVKLLPDARSGPGYLAAGLSLVALLLAVWLLPETRRVGQPGPHRGRVGLGRLFETLRTPTVGLLVLTFFLATFGFSSFEGTLALFTQEVFRYDEDANYLVFAYVGAVLMVAQGLVYRRLTKYLDEVTFVRVGVLLMFLGLAGLAVVALVAAGSPSGELLFAGFLGSLACAVFGFAFLNPSIQALVSKRSDPHRQGEVLGVNQAFSALARIFGPAVGLAVFPFANHVLPYVVAAGLLGIVLVLVPRIRRQP